MGIKNELKLLQENLKWKIIEAKEAAHALNTIFGTFLVGAILLLVFVIVLTTVYGWLAVITYSVAAFFVMFVLVELALVMVVIRNIEVNE